MIKQIIALFKKKPKKVNKVSKKIRFIEHTWATLEKPPPNGLCSVGINEPIIIPKHSVLVQNGTDDTYIYFRVFNPFLAVNKEAPDLSIVRISKYRFNNLSKHYRNV